MGDLSKNFSRNEFTCLCGCGQDTVDAELIMVLENLREKLFSRAIMILSGCRCQKHNDNMGGRPLSYHILGKAADIVVDGASSDIVVECLKDIYPERYGIGSYPKRKFIHVDVRTKKARW